MNGREKRCNALNIFINLGWVWLVGGAGMMIHVLYTLHVGRMFSEFTQGDFLVSVIEMPIGIVLFNIGITILTGKMNDDDLIDKFKLEFDKYTKKIHNRMNRLGIPEPIGDEMRFLLTDYLGYLNDAQLEEFSDLYSEASESIKEIVDREFAKRTTV